jgi:lipopolysaccharide/colanic/teichoic acid biosynthesis glycosyltransferase
MRSPERTRGALAAASIEVSARDLKQLAEEVDWNAAMPARVGGLAWRAQWIVKRVVDVLIAAAGLVVLLPLFCVVALVVTFDSRGSVFYPWRVVGHRGHPFTGYKFRTMVPNADAQRQALRHRNEMSGPVFKIREDPRVTRVGRFLRKYSVDELPELWSVLVGDMSLVGPRPLGWEEFRDCQPLLRRKLSVRPGITCLWQVSGRSEIQSFEEWVRLDLEYIRNWSLWLDLKILARTVKVVILGVGAY